MCLLDQVALLVDRDQSSKAQAALGWRIQTYCTLSAINVYRASSRHFEVATTINFEFNEASAQHIMSLGRLDQ
jgi:[protein-PII] uridylyltransferase